MMNNPFEDWEVAYVESSLIKAVAIPKIKTPIRVLLANGRMYEYNDVPLSLATDLATAESVGTFFNSHIKNKFQYREIQQQPIEGEING